VIYRLDGDTWNEVDITEAGDLSTLELDALATGPGGEIRAVGTGVDGTGFCLRRAGGHWSLMSIEPPSAWAGGGWALSCISRAPSGTWYAGGPLVGKPGGALLVDDGSGWKPGAPVSPLEESINGLATDPNGALWAASNHAVGDKFQGTIFKITGNTATAFPVRRQTAGNFRIFGIGFSSTGRGWTVGGRDPDDPFFAGFDGQSWLESVVEVDLTPIAAPIRPASAHPQSVKEEVFGGELFDVSVLSEDIAFAAGQAEEVSGDGDHELIPRLFKVRRLLLELDRPTPKTPLQPY
jgi:hypothetical protein